MANIAYAIAKLIEAIGCAVHDMRIIHEGSNASEGVYAEDVYVRLANDVHSVLNYYEER